MYYKGWHVADSELKFTEWHRDSLMISWHANTRSLFYLLFPLDNTYKSIWTKKDLKLHRFEKSIKQKNIEQNWKIYYNHSKGHAKVDSSRQWNIQPGCRSLVGLIYTLRIQNPVCGDSVSFFVDIESQIWQLQGRIRIPSEHPNTPVAPDREIIFTFKPADEIKERSWDTDLLTNNIGRDKARLYILLGPSPENIPVLISFENIDKPVSMRFISRTESNL